jgi:hypothetical protein
VTSPQMMLPQKNALYHMNGDPPMYIAIGSDGKIYFSEARFAIKGLGVWHDEPAVNEATGQKNEKWIQLVAGFNSLPGCLEVRFVTGPERIKIFGSGLPDVVLNHKPQQAHHVRTPFTPRQESLHVSVEVPGERHVSYYDLWQTAPDLFNALDLWD